jgi:hypothetical protein
MKTESQPMLELTPKDDKFLESYGLQPKTKITFFVRPPKTLLLLLIVSLGFYGFYWFYKNWQAVAAATENKISPFWRTVLGLFYTWPLFKIMVLQARSRGFDKNYSGGWLTIGYLFAPMLVEWLYRPGSYNVGSFVLSLVGVAITTWFMLMAQEAAAFALKASTKATEGSAADSKITKVEIIFTILGLVFIGGMYAILLLNA